LQLAKGATDRRALLLLLLDLQRRSEDQDGQRATLQRLLAEAGGEEEKVAAVTAALQAVEPGQSPRLRLLLLETLLQLRPNQAELYLQLGDLQCELRSWAAAATAFARFEELTPDKLDALSQVARSYGKARRLDLGLQVMSRMVQLGQDDPRTLLSVIELRLEQSGPADQESLG